MRFFHDGNFFLVPGDKSALNPSGLRLGTPALTTRGLKEDDMAQVASLIHKGKDEKSSILFYFWILKTNYVLNLGILLAQEVQTASGPKLADFKSVLQKDEVFVDKIQKLKNEVESFAEKFYMPGQSI